MKISIITVCYNSKNTLEQTIQSVLFQKYPDKEYIIIDGNSTDGTKEIIELYKSSLAYWCSETDSGLYDAMNKGVRHATGDVIAFLNSDDWYEKDTIEKVARYFTCSDFDLICGNINKVINERIIPRQQHDYSAEEIRIQLIHPHQALFAKTDIFKQIGGFDLQYKIAADYDWMLRAHLHGFRTMTVRDVFTNCRDGGISSINGYECALEQRYIAHFYSKSYFKNSYKERIEERYNPGIEDAQDNIIYNKVIEEKWDKVKQLFRKDTSYYIWGTGVWGERCYQLFEKLGMRVEGFIDSQKREDEIYGYTVYKPRQIDNNACICIATRAYEGEIINQIKEMGIVEDRYVTFSELKEKIVEWGKQNLGEFD